MCSPGYYETKYSAHCSHHVKPRACLCLLAHCRVLRKAERSPPCVARSCWSPGHSKSATFMFRECEPVSFHVALRFSTCLFSLVFRAEPQDRLERKVDGMRYCIKCCGATVLVRTRTFIVGHRQQVSAQGWNLWKWRSVFRASRMAKSSWLQLHQLQNGFAVCTTVQRVCFPLQVLFSSCPPHSRAHP